MILFSRTNKSDNIVNVTHPKSPLRGDFNTLLKLGHKECRRNKYTAVFNYEKDDTLTLCYCDGDVILNLPEKD